MTISEVKVQLKIMAEAEQQVRSTFPIYQPKIAELKREHSKVISKIISQWGAIDVVRFGEEAARDAAFVVQHSPLRIKRKYLDLLEDTKSTIYKRGYAYLKDRVLVADKKSQLYGTQMKVLNSKGELAFNPIADFLNIDKRRAEVGLEPFSDYVNTVEEMTGRKPPILLEEG